MGKCDLHKLRECCLLPALGLWKQRNAFPSGQCPSRAPTRAGTVLRCGCSEEPQSSLCCPSWGKSPLMDNFSTDLAEPGGNLGLRSGTHLAGRWVAAPGWGLQCLWRGTAAALPSHQVVMSSGPAVLHHVHRSVDVLCASILFTFLPISIRFDCGHSLVDRGKRRVNPILLSCPLSN